MLVTAFSEHAREESSYKLLQRFLRSFIMPHAEVAAFVIKLLGISGPYTLALDRTNWQVGSVDLKILLRLYGKDLKPDKGFTIYQLKRQFCDDIWQERIDRSDAKWRKKFDEYKAAT